jgi:FkbM family methyltransferase
MDHWSRMINRVTGTNFLATNHRLIESIEVRLARIRATATSKAADAVPELQAWLQGFELTWDEICRQQGWADTPATSLGRILEHLLRIGPRALSARLTVKGGKSRPYNASAVFTEPSPTFPVAPDQTEYDTAYGFRLVTSGTDMWHAFATGHYEAEIVETILLLRLAEHVDSFVDVGANIGFYSLLMASQGLPVIACEPASANALRLRSGVSINGFGDSVTIVEAAIGSDEDEHDLKLALGSGGHSLSPTTQPIHGSERVAGTRLDAIVAQHDLGCSVVKIDVEGYENEVLAGATEWMRSRMAPVIIVEAWPDTPSRTGDNHTLVIHALISHGYRVSRISQSYETQATLDAIEHPRDLTPADSGNYLALPPWAANLHEPLTRRIDARVLAPTQRLAAIDAFLARTHRSLKKAVSH